MEFWVQTHKKCGREPNGANSMGICPAASEMKIYKKLDLHLDLARSYWNQGASYRSLNKPKDSLNYYQQATRIFADYGDEVSLANCLWSQGYTLEMLEYISDQVKLWSHAIDILRSHNLPVTENEAELQDLRRSSRIEDFNIIKIDMFTLFMQSNSYFFCTNFKSYKGSGK